MASATLDAWLGRLESMHPSAIDLGLDRLRRVATRAGLLDPGVPLVIVAGTNGKGSTVAMLEAAWQAAGYRTGACTSPHVIDFNERIHVDGAPLDDGSIVRAFEAIEPALAADTLTYFEYSTLAAVQAFVTARCEVIVLEVGLGGRLDAANLWDADVAVLTSVALDHADWLGTDLEVIATEKAAVARRGRPLVVGESAPPASLAPWAAAHGVRLVPVGEADAPAALEARGAHQRRNAACALAVVRLLGERLPVDERAALRGISGARAMARLERREVDGVEVWLDVAHNPAGAAAVAEALGELWSGRGHLVFAVLVDKDVEGIAGALAPRVASVACLALDGPRALAPDVLAARVRAVLPESTPVEAYADVAAAWRSVLERARADGAPVLVAGSFTTVTALLDAGLL